MPFDEGLAQRIREVLVDALNMEEKRMFGGIAFLHRGNLACGIVHDDLVVRVGPDEHAAALKRPHAHEFDMTGRVMKGWIQVAPRGTAADKDLSAWVKRGLAFASSLPPKAKKPAT